MSALVALMVCGLYGRQVRLNDLSTDEAPSEYQREHTTLFLKNFLHRVVLLGGRGRDKDSMIEYSGAGWWNQIPKEMRNSSSFRSFYVRLALILSRPQPMFFCSTLVSLAVSLYLV